MAIACKTPRSIQMEKEFIVDDTQPYLVIVEDNPDDSFWLKRELKKADLDMPVTLLADGKKALDFFSNCPVLPAALFLDIHLPGASGTELLRTLTANVDLDKMVVFILDGSSRPDEIAECERLGIAGFLDKPVTVEDLISFVVPRLRATNKA